MRAYWHHKASASGEGVLVGDSGNAKRLAETFSSEAWAREAAQAEWDRLQRSAATMNVSISLAMPVLFAEQTLTLGGLKAAICSGKWMIAKVTHAIGGDGFVTSVELELTS